MALIIPPGFAQAVYRHRRSGDTEDMLTTCGHEIDSASGANAEDIANDLANAWIANIVPGYSGPTTFVGCDVYVGQDGPDPLVVTSSVAAVAGPNSNALAPQNCAVLVRKRTDAAGRRGRGRMYIPEVPESSVNDVGTLDSGFVAAVNSRFDAWRDFLVGGVGARLYPPVVLHRSEGIGEEPPPTPITAFVCETRIATQRRRLRP